VAVARNGFVVTGAGSSPLASSVPGVFAVGDVRAQSVKHVGSAVGEGAQVVVALHGFLASNPPASLSERLGLDSRAHPPATARRARICSAVPA